MIGENAEGIKASLGARGHVDARRGTRWLSRLADKSSEHGARTGFAAGNFGTPEVPNALLGARTGFAAGGFGSPEEARADTVMQRPPNLVLNQSSVAGPPPQTQYDTSLPPVGAGGGIADRLRGLSGT